MNMQNIFERKSRSVITQSEEQMLSLVGNHIQKKLISENMDNISLDDDSHQILEQMVKDRKLYEEIKCMHRDLFKKQQNLDIQKGKFIQDKGFTQSEKKGQKIRFQSFLPFFQIAIILVALKLIIYIMYKL